MPKLDSRPALYAGAVAALAGVAGVFCGLSSSGSGPEGIILLAIAQWLGALAFWFAFLSVSLWQIVFICEYFAAVFSCGNEDDDDEEEDLIQVE